MAADIHISVVVPCYGEEQVLSELHRRLTTVCLQTGRTYELVFVDDGSKDGTWAKMLELSAGDPCLLAIKLSRNHGHQLALTAGLTLCRGQRILIMDADLQDPPELLPQMLKLMDDGADVVYGQRVQRQGEPLGKRATAFLFYRIIRYLTEVPIPMDTGDFRLLSRRALDALLSMPERHRFIRGMVSWIGFRQVPLPYERHARYAGQTKYPLRKMLRFALDAVTAFSIKPLTLASWLGLFGAIFSLALFLWVIKSWWVGGTVAGWASVLAGVTLIGSAQLLVLGIIGEYVGRLYEQSKGRPLFIVDQAVRSPDRAHSILVCSEEPASTVGSQPNDASTLA